MNGRDEPGRATDDVMSAEEFASVDPDRPLTEHKAKGVAEALRRQDMFDEVNVEPPTRFG